MARKPTPLEQRLKRLEERIAEQDKALVGALNTITELRTKMEAATLRKRTGDLERAKTADLEHEPALPRIVEHDADTEVTLPGESLKPESK